MDSSIGLNMDSSIHEHGSSIDVMNWFCDGQAPGDGVGGGRGEWYPDLRAEQHLRQGIHLN